MFVSNNDESVMLFDDEVDGIVKIFKALADKTRVKVISILTSPKKHRVSEIAKMLDMEVSRISHQLTKLEDMGFVKGIRDGRNIYYEIQDECIKTILRTAKDHISGK